MTSYMPIWTMYNQVPNINKHNSYNKNNIPDTMHTECQEKCQIKKFTSHNIRKFFTDSSVK